MLGFLYQMGEAKNGPPKTAEANPSNDDSLNLRHRFLTRKLAMPI